MNSLLCIVCCFAKEIEILYFVVEEIWRDLNKSRYKKKQFREKNKTHRKGGSTGGASPHGAPTLTWEGARPSARPLSDTDSASYHTSTATGKYCPYQQQEQCGTRHCPYRTAAALMGALLPMPLRRCTMRIAVCRRTGSSRAPACSVGRLVALKTCWVCETDKGPEKL